MENKERHDLVEFLVQRYKGRSQVMKLFFWLALVKFGLAVGFGKVPAAVLFAGEACVILALPKDEFEKKIELIAQDLKEILKQRGLAPN